MITIEDDYPRPKLVKSSKGWCACWSRADYTMRTAGRSALESDEWCGSVDDVFLRALRSDDPILHWSDLAAVKDLASRVAAFQASSAIDLAIRAQIVFKLEPPIEKDLAASWRLKLERFPATVAGYRALGQACKYFPPLRNMMGREVLLTSAEVERYLGTGGAALCAAGYTAQRDANFVKTEVTATAELLPIERTNQKSCKESLKCKLTVHIAGEEVTRDEIAFLLDQGSSLVFFRGRWIEVDRAILKNAFKALEVTETKVTPKEAYAWAFGFRRPRGLRLTAVNGKGWFGKVLDEIKRGPAFKLQRVPSSFKGKLHAYQRRGAAWIGYLIDRGFGALLADDMGLGKTVQTIVWLLTMRNRSVKPQGPALVVAPVSVTMNWMREFNKFAPSLKVLLYQGKERLEDAKFLSTATKYDVLVTGYPLFKRAFSLLSEVKVSALILDEAQMIKNPDTASARAARAFPCDVRIALTGTPFENSAIDLWSIEEFLNPGLVGARADFIREFVQPIRDDAQAPAAKRLRRLLEPFLLRRLKTDPKVAAELGPKREIREYCPLSSAQRIRYETALFRYAEEGRERNGKGTIVDRGRALALLTELKLICDGFNSGVSGAKGISGGKVERLDALLDDITALGESCLIFTQYVRVAEKLRAHIEENRGERVFFLHGGLTVAEREAEIAAFSATKGPAIFLLSLKAGGFGLNLVKATHVIHYDRWWNPAVENQATDRAHRIGQAHTVFVHLFISAGTLEDHIDELLETKRTLATDLITAGESFLLRLSNQDFGKALALT